MNATSIETTDRTAEGTGVRGRRKAGPSRAGRALIFATALGAIVGTATIAFIYQLVFVYFLLFPDGIESRGAAEDLGGGVLPQVFLALGTLFAAFTAGYLGRWRPTITGLVCGAAAATTEQAIVLFGYPPVLPAELMGFVAAGLLSGLLGGWLGGLGAERHAGREKASYDAVRAMGVARDEDAVAAALVGVLGGVGPTGLAVWRQTQAAEPGAPEGAPVAPPAGKWSSRAAGRSAGGFSPEEMLTAAEIDRLPSRGLALAARGLSPARRASWRARGVGSVFLVPMLATAGESTGLLAVAFASGGRAGRLRASWFARRRLLSASAVASMALTNLHLARHKERADRRAGAVDERLRWAREMHDSIVQCLTGGVIKQLENAERASSLGAEGKAIEHLQKADKAAKRAVAEARSLMSGMRPEAMASDPVPEAVIAASRRVLEDSGIGLRCEVEGTPRPLVPETGEALVRVAQGALENTRKHSGASTATVTLCYRPDRVMLKVADDGVGLGAKGGHPQPYEGRDGGLGIPIMRGRVRELGGTLDIEQAAGGGVVVVSEVPLNGGPAPPGGDRSRDRGLREDRVARGAAALGKLFGK